MEQTLETGRPVSHSGDAVNANDCVYNLMPIFQAVGRLFDSRLPRGRSRQARLGSELDTVSQGCRCHALYMLSLSTEILGASAYGSAGV